MYPGGFFGTVNLRDCIQNPQDTSQVVIEGDDLMDRTRKQFAVIGLGRFGTSVAITLQSLGHEVLAVDADE